MILNSLMVNPLSTMRVGEGGGGFIDGDIDKENFLIIVIYFVFFKISTLPPILLHYLKSTLKYTKHPHGYQHPSKDDN